jgi:hypothetical protein
VKYSVESIEERISREARRFDPAALRDLLLLLGYKDDDIEYRSHPSTLHQSSVISSVQFEKTPRRRVLIFVNVGWLGPQSPLPNYFQKILSQQREETLSDFLGFFSHHLLSAGFGSGFPERNPRLFRDWPKSQQKLRSLLGLRSLSTIHWTFSLIFPEMEVAVERTILQRRVYTRGLVLGGWAIGDGAACGGVSWVPVAAARVTLLCDESQSGTGIPWGTLALSRLHSEAFPALSAHGLFLCVQLVLRDQASFMTLTKDQHLGYDPITDGVPDPPPDRKTARVVVLWSGEVPRPQGP